MKKLFTYFKYYKKETVLAPTFKLLEAIIELFIPLIVSKIIDVGIASSNNGYVVKMVLLMVLCGFIGLIFSIAGQYFSAKSAVGFVTKLRYDLFKKLESLSFTDIDDLGTSSMITRMTSDVSLIQTGINLTLRLFLRSPFVVFGAAIMATIIAPNIAYIFWIAIPVLSIVIFGIMLITIPLHKKVQEQLDNVLENTRENLTGVRVVRAFGQEERFIENYQQSTLKLEKSQNKVGNISNLMNPLTYVIINLAIVILIYNGGVEVDKGIILQGGVIALYNYMSQILVELIKLANLIITITKSLACGKRIIKILDLDTSVELNEHIKVDKPYIDFENVFLKYKNAGDYSLENINFTVNKGETIGVIGGTGSGKSSLVNLLPRFYDVTCGKIYFDGYDLNSYDLVELRDRIGIVLQKAVLFKGTIKENILWGNPLANDEDIKNSLIDGQCEDIIIKKEKGIDSDVEQNGKNFSGGQRQRLSIARALVKKPEILILDDSSSALDFATDALLRKAIKKLNYKPTVFIVSQRTTSIQNADKIIVLDDGKLVGCGTHEDLLRNCQIYQEIHYSQVKKEEVK